MALQRARGRGNEPQKSKRAVAAKRSGSGGKWTHSLAAKKVTVKRPHGCGVTSKSFLNPRAGKRFTRKDIELGLAWESVREHTKQWRYHFFVVWQFKPTKADVAMLKSRSRCAK